MKNKLIMKLIVDGEEKQKLEADLASITQACFRKVRKISGIPKISGEHHINPKVIKTVKEAYLTFESISREYPQNKQVTIEALYK